MFEPIAIIGQSCLLPGVCTPTELWNTVLTQSCTLQSATADLWRIPPKSIVAPTGYDTVFSDVCGFIENFDDIFNAEGFELDPEWILKQDVLCQWLLHVSREALCSAGYPLPYKQKYRLGAVMGILSYPTAAFNRYAEAIWLQEQDPALLAQTGLLDSVHPVPLPESRFMCGHACSLLRRALNLTANAFAVDAACASSLYAIKLACDQLHTRQADMMLAGGINATDSLFLQIGFTALQALSRSGQSRPLHRAADGLVPTQGAAMVLLKRLEDAIEAKDNILGVIRGIGLANDGHHKGFLVPSAAGQVRAMEQAYRLAGIKPNEVSWLECHATGTILGDATEISSMRQIFGDKHPLAIGTLKSNIGHSITVSGAAAVINALSAMQQQLLPPSMTAADSVDALQDTAFILHSQTQPWNTPKGRTRIAAINAFGFGGNNAHLLLEEWRAQKIRHQPSSSPSIAKEKEQIAVVGIGVIAANTNNVKEFAHRLFEHKSEMSVFYKDFLGGVIQHLDLDLASLRFPPSELQCALAQQLAIVKAAQEALGQVNRPSKQRTSVFIGMECDVAVTRLSLRARLAALAKNISVEWLEQAKNAICVPMQSGNILGMMPNIVANRLNYLFDFQEASFSVFNEELSGIIALELGSQALLKNEIDMAVVGAVDLCCDVVHVRAMQERFSIKEPIPGDAAVILVLKRASEAEKQGDCIYALLEDVNSTQNKKPLELDTQYNTINRLFGYPMSAVGLLHVAALALACYQRLHPMALHERAFYPWLDDLRLALLQTRCLSGTTQITLLQAGPRVQGQKSLLAPPLAKIWYSRGENRAALARSLEQNMPQSTGAAALAIVYDHTTDWQTLVQTIIPILVTGEGELPPGVYLQDKPINGKIAFVFTGATTSYSGMGQELFFYFPEILSALSAKIQSTPDILYDLSQLNSGVPLSLFQELRTYSLLAQFHATLCFDKLKIQPDLCIGYCSGETNALMACGVWEDCDGLFADIAASQIYTKTLAGEFSVLEAENREWTTWRLFEEADRVKRLLQDEPNIHMTIINSSHDCLIAGPSTACEQFIMRLQSTRVRRLDPCMVIHCEKFAPIKELWHQLHWRKTSPMSNIAFYSTFLGKSYTVTSDTAAEMITAQAGNTVYFPGVIEQAWQDGARVFIELGPRNLCTRWIDDILREKEHVAVSLDNSQLDGMRQLACAVAQLLVAGIDISYDFLR